MVLHEIYLSSLNNYLCSLRSRRSKGNGEGIRARDCAQGKREEGGGRREEGNACKEAIVFAN